MDTLDIRARRIRTVTFILLYVGYCVSYIDRASISLAMVHIGRDLHFGKAEFGFVASVFYLGYALMQIPGGWLADRFGSRIVIVGAIGFWSIFTSFTGFAWSVTSLLLIRFIFGLGEGSYSASSLKAIAENYPRESRPKMTSLLLSSNYVGSFVAPLVIAPMIIGLGWRDTFTYSGIAGVVFTMVYFFVSRAKTPDPVEAPIVTATVTKKKFDKSDVLLLLKYPLIYKIVILWFAISMVSKGLDAWMPIYLMTERHLDLAAVGLLTPLPFVAASVATAMGGWLMSKYFDGREKYLMAGCCVITGGFIYAMYSAETVAGVIAAQTVVYFFKSIVFANIYAFPLKLLPQRMVGTAAGIINTGGQSAGFVAPAAIGLIVSFSGSYSSAFGLLVGSMVLATLASISLGTSRLKESSGAAAA